MAPGFGTVRAAEQAAPVGSGVQGLRVDRAEGHSANVQRREAVAGLDPGLAAVGCLVNALARAGVKDVGVGRIDEDRADVRVCQSFLDPIP